MQEPTITFNANGGEITYYDLAGQEKTRQFFSRADANDTVMSLWRGKDITEAEALEFQRRILQRYWPERPRCPKASRLAQVFQQSPTPSGLIVPRFYN